MSSGVSTFKIFEKFKGCDQKNRLRGGGGLALHFRGGFFDWDIFRGGGQWPNLQLRGGIIIISLYPRDCVCQAGTLPDKLYIRNLCCTQMKVISRSYKVFCQYRFGLGFIFNEDIGYLIYIL